MTMLEQVSDLPLQVPASACLSVTVSEGTTISARAGQAEIGGFR
jgi:hypothetical protein